MRNLSLSASTVTSLSSASISATAADLENDVLYLATEKQNLDADVQVEIWKIVLEGNGKGSQSVPELLTMFTAVAYPSATPLISQIVSFRTLPDIRRLSVIMRCGDITMISLDEEDFTVDVEGTVESGILAAAFNPDDSLLCLVTGEDKLILMTSGFDVVSEAPLHNADFGEDAPINVGWGSKQTQFHGSLGKAAAQAPSVLTVGSSPDDDTLPRISWRGDGTYFVVSALTSVNTLPRHRVLRVYDRQATLQSTSEAVPGLEHPISWRPSGNLIVSTQRFGFEGGGAGQAGRHDVVFFERNGLRHGEFRIRTEDLNIQPSSTSKLQSSRKWGYKVRELAWSSDSNVLGVWIEGEDRDLIQLWTTGNYHWYLKQEIPAPILGSSQPSRFTSMTWHPEVALNLILTTPSEVIQRIYSWETFSSSCAPPNDTGAVAVFDGPKILLTPFRTQNVPPPMSSYQMYLTSTHDSPIISSRDSTTTPIHASFSTSNDMFAVLWELGRIELWDLHTRIGPGPEKVMEPIRLCVGFVDDVRSYNSRQIMMWQGNGSVRVGVLGSDRQNSDILTVLEFDGSAIIQQGVVLLPERNGRLIASHSDFIWQAPDGGIFRVDFHQDLVASVSRFPEFCFSSQQIVDLPSDPHHGSNMSISVGLSSSGRLYAANATSSRVLATNATSFTIASSFVIFTTSAHEAFFVPSASLPSMLAADGEGDHKSTEWERRKIERGSRIVVAVPSSMSLVLQMPRGNLETINPRPLVIEVIRQDLDAGNYRKAFFACRKHRIDLNVLVDHDQAAFLEGLSSFVDQIHEVDHVNLFLTGLGRGSQPPEVITKLCDAMRVELETKDLTKYVNSILTAYVVKSPPDHEAALSLLLRLRDNNRSLVEDAVKYIIFLVDADSLFDTALGMYDFSLVLMIAQHAQKDPREYLPFLRELRALEKYYQRFKIDDHLRRHEKALRNLSLAGADHFDEAMAYIEQHRLYESALSLWNGTVYYKSVLTLFGDWLFDRREFRQAALVFVEAKAIPKAMIAHEKALEWQELFELALRQKVPEAEIVSMGYRVAEDLSTKKRYSEAATVLLDYSQDVREAVISLVQGSHFSEARRITTLHSQPILMTDIVHPGALESRAQIVEDVQEMQEQLRKQVRRLHELRIKKSDEPDAYYGEEGINLHNVDTMTDVSMPATAFTRYTVAPTSASRSSKRSSRSKRKMERKVGSGRKGTVDEEEYLLKSVTKLVGRFTTTQGEARSLLPHLFQFSEEHRVEGLSLQNLLSAFESELKEALEEIWHKPPPPEGEGNPVDSWATRMEEKEKEQRINAIEKVPKPELGGQEWHMPLMQLTRDINVTASST